MAGLVVRWFALLACDLKSERYVRNYNIKSDSPALFFNLPGYFAW